MPEDLYTSYERILLQLSFFDPGTAISNERLVFRILVFVAFSGRPVTVAEAAEFAIIENSADKIQEEDRFDDPIAVLPFVGSLVSVQNQILTLSHKSVKDFLESPRARHGPLQLGKFLGITGVPDDTSIAADIYIAQKCLGYLALPQPSAREAKLSSEVKDPNMTYLLSLQKENPLLDYAASTWPYHIRANTAQRKTRVEMEYALRLNAPNRPPNLWQGWLFLQRADIWEQQLRLVILLCDCFIRSTLVDGWANNFWHFRQKYRVGKAPKKDAIASKTVVHQCDGASKIPLALRSKQFDDLAVLLLEVAFQKSLYSQHQVEMMKVQTVAEMKTYMNFLHKRSKEVIPRMGAGYHAAISECLNLVVHREVEGPNARPIFDVQRNVIDMVLQPLRSSASSGFRISRGIRSFKAADVSSLFAKVETDEASYRFSVPLTAFEKLSSALDPRANAFSRTHGPDGSLRKPVALPKLDQSTTTCGECKKVFSSVKEMERHKAEKRGYCPTCRVCLSSGSWEEHDSRYHRVEPKDVRWSVR